MCMLVHQCRVSTIYENCTTLIIFLIYLLLCPCRGGIKRYTRLTSVWLSVAYIGPKSRKERPRKTKIGTEVAHVTRDSDTTFKVKRSEVKVTCEAGAYCSGLPHSLFLDNFYLIYLHKLMVALAHADVLLLTPSLTQSPEIPSCTLSTSQFLLGRQQCLLAVEREAAAVQQSIIKLLRPMLMKNRNRSYALGVTAPNERIDDRRCLHSSLLLHLPRHTGSRQQWRVLDSV